MSASDHTKHPPDNPHTVDRLLVVAEDDGATVQFDGSHPFLRDGNHFEIVLGADEKARQWGDITADMMTEHGNSYLVALVDWGVVASGEIHGIERDGGRVVLGAHRAGGPSEILADGNGEDER